VDSRTSPEIVFDAGIGDIVSIRIAGNIINDDIIGSIELACKELGTKLIVVKGHSKCGAVGVAVNSAAHGNITHITDQATS
ncbi:MAG: carbonic anhydrase, partial [Pseudomonadota bacterium]